MNTYKVEFKWWTFRKDMIIKADWFSIFLGTVAFYKRNLTLDEIAHLEDVKNVYQIN